MTDYSSLIPGMRDCDGTPWIDVQNWLYTQGNYEILIACGALFWPTFLEYKDCIVRHSSCNNYIENYARLTADGPVERGYVEERLNRLEIVDIISPTNPASLSMEQAIHIGELLKQMWQAKLTSEFPNRDFHVSFFVYDGDRVEDLALTFCQKRSYLIE